MGLNTYLNNWRHRVIHVVVLHVLHKTRSIRPHHTVRAVCIGHTSSTAIIDTLCAHLTVLLFNRGRIDQNRITSA